MTEAKTNISEKTTSVYICDTDSGIPIYVNTQSGIFFVQHVSYRSLLDAKKHKNFNIGDYVISNLSRIYKIIKVYEQYAVAEDPFTGYANDVSASAFFKIDKEKFDQIFNLQKPNREKILHLRKDADKYYYSCQNKINDITREESKDIKRILFGDSNESVI